MRQGCYILFMLLVSACINLAYADVNDAGVKIKWDYKGNIGPARWSHLDHAFALCVTGKEQSPIDLPKTSASSPSQLSLNYSPAVMVIENDGPTDLFFGDTKTIVNTGHTIQLNYHNKNEYEAITFANETYRLVQLHFHTPSEHQLHGDSFPLEIHFVHQSDHGKVLVIAVFVERGEKNETLQRIINHLPNDMNQEHVIAAEKISPAALLPQVKDYYSYVGSLTVPPCTQGVQWLIMREPIKALPGQIMQMRRAVGYGSARPVQPLNERIVSYSVEK